MWNFTAEIAVIVLIQWVIGILLLRQILSMRDATIIICCYPLSLIMVYVLQNVMGIK